MIVSFTMRNAGARSGAIFMAALIIAGAGPDHSRAMTVSNGGFSASWKPTLPAASAGFGHWIAGAADPGHEDALRASLTPLARQTLQTFLDNPSYQGILETQLNQRRGADYIQTALDAAHMELENLIAKRGQEIVQAVAEGRADAIALKAASGDLIWTAGRLGLLARSVRTANVVLAVQILEHHIIDDHEMSAARSLARNILDDHGIQAFGTVSLPVMDRAQGEVLGREGRLAANSHLLPPPAFAPETYRLPEPPSIRSHSVSRRPPYQGDEIFGDILSAVSGDFTWHPQGQGKSLSIQGFAKEGQPLVFGVAAVRLSRHDGQTDLELTVVHDERNQAADFRRGIDRRVWSTRRKTILKTRQWFSLGVYKTTHRLTRDPTEQPRPATTIRLRGKFGEANDVFFRDLMKSLKRPTPRGALNEPLLHAPTNAEPPMPKGLFNEPLFLTMIRNPEIRPFGEILGSFPQEFRWEAKGAGHEKVIYGFRMGGPLAMGLHSVQILRENGETNLLLYMIHDDQRQADEFRGRVSAALRATQVETGTPDFSVLGKRQERTLLTQENGRPVTRSFPETVIGFRGRFSDKNDVFFRHLIESERARTPVASTPASKSAAPSASPASKIGEDRTSPRSERTEGTPPETQHGPAATPSRASPLAVAQAAVEPPSPPSAPAIRLFPRQRRTPGKSRAALYKTMANPAQGGAIPLDDLREILRNTPTLARYADQAGEFDWWADRSPDETAIIGITKRAGPFQAKVIKITLNETGVLESEVIPASPQSAVNERPPLEEGFDHTLFAALLQNPAMRDFIPILRRFDRNYEWSVLGREPGVMVVGRAKTNPLNLDRDALVETIRLVQVNGQAELTLEVTHPGRNDLSQRMYRPKDSVSSVFVTRVRSAERITRVGSASEFSVGVRRFSSDQFESHRPFARTILRLAGQYQGLNGAFIDNLLDPNLEMIDETPAPTQAEVPQAVDSRADRVKKIQWKPISSL